MCMRTWASAARDSARAREREHLAAVIAEMMPQVTSRDLCQSPPELPMRMRLSWPVCWSPCAADDRDVGGGERQGEGLHLPSSPSISLDDTSVEESVKEKVFISLHLPPSPLMTRRWRRASRRRSSSPFISLHLP